MNARPCWAETAERSHLRELDASEREGLALEEIRTQMVNGAVASLRGSESGMDFVRTPRSPGLDQYIDQQSALDAFNVTLTMPRVAELFHRAMRCGHPDVVAFCDAFGEQYAVDNAADVASLLASEEAEDRL